MADSSRPRASSPGQAIGLGVAVALIMALFGIFFFGWAVLGGVVLGVIVAWLSWPKGIERRTSRELDPFTISEPWRQYVQAANRSRRTLRSTVSGVRDGPLKERLDDIARRLDGAVEQASAIASRGHEVDGAIKNIDPVRLRSQLATLESQQASADVQAAIASVQSQLATSDRLKGLSKQTADRLRLSQARLDELVARAAEVGVGASDTEAYAHDVDELNRELEALGAAVGEANRTDDLAAGRVVPSVSFDAPPAAAPPTVAPADVVDGPAPTGRTEPGSPTTSPPTPPA